MACVPRRFCFTAGGATPLSNVPVIDEVGTFCAIVRAGERFALAVLNVSRLTPDALVEAWIGYSEAEGWKLAQ